MASASNVLRTCGLFIYLIFQVNASANNTSDLNIQSLEVGSVECDINTCKYLLNVSGGEFLGHHPWRLTSEEGVKGGSCETIFPNYEISEINTSQWLSQLAVSVPNSEGKIYFCLRRRPRTSPFGGVWVHQGDKHFLEPKIDVASKQNNGQPNTDVPPRRDSSQDQRTETQASITLKDVTKENLQNDVTDDNVRHKEVTKDSDTQQHVTNDMDAQRNVTNDDDGQQYVTNDKDVQKDMIGDNLQEAKVDWADLSHDTDVNYLPGAPRPTREEKNDIEVLYHDKYIPLNDLIEHFEIDSKQTVHDDAFDDANRVDFEINSTTRDVDTNLDENNNRESLNVNNKSKNVYVKIDKEKYFKEFEELDAKIQFDKCDYLIKEIKTLLEELNSLPDADTVEEILTRCMVNNICIENAVPDRIDNNIEQNDANTYLIDKYLEWPLSNAVSKDKVVEELLETSFPKDTFTGEAPALVRRPRTVSSGDFYGVKSDVPILVLEGVRVEDSDKEPKIVDDGIPSVLADSSVTLRVYGQGLTPQTVIAFTHDPQLYGLPCKFLLKGEYMVKKGSLQARTALFDIRVPPSTAGDKLYICAKNLLPGAIDPTNDEEKYLHMGTEKWKILACHNQLLPLWVSISLILFCLMFSALFSGLNLGLMSLDRTELKIIANTGTDQEKKYARAIMPVRDHGNYLLCSILLGNVAVNSTFTILLDELTSGLFAVIFSTLAIVLLGEITPQAICSRHGLMVGAKSIMVTKGVMAVTAPLSFPVSKLLDYFLGEEIGNVYNRERLKELVKVTTDVNDLDKDEVNIISGALEMRKKTVSHVMTKLEDVFMLPISSVLDFETMSEIVKSGYSRIPVYEGGRGNIVTVLFIKDLAFVDPDDNTPLRTLCQYYQNAAHFVFEDVTLDVIFKQFKDGHKGHMAFVHRINNEGEGDPFYETIGLVTLEDVIEEMIQAEIVDETDVFLDNRSKRRRRPQNKLQDFAAFAERHENQRIHISPQLTLATFQFLSTSVDAFRPDTVSETVLRRLLRQDVIQYIKIKGKSKKDPTTFVFQQGKPVDYFLLILEGRVEVTVGRENLVFEAGPFTYFGVQALTQNVGVAESPSPSAMGSLQNINMDAMLRHTFVPDYSVRAITSVYYLTVKRSLYLAAKRATLMEKGNISKGGTTQEFDTEVDKAYAVVQCSSATCNNAHTDNARRTEGSKSTNACTIHCLNPNDVDANTCAECIKNNFWMSRNVLIKNIADSQHFKKKKATFHTDSSLLSFHDLSSTSQEEIEYNPINRELGPASNHECIPSKSNAVELDKDSDMKLDRGNHSKCPIIDLKFREIDYALVNSNDRAYLNYQGGSIYTQINKNCRNVIDSDIAKIDNDLDYLPERNKCRGASAQRREIEYESQIDSNRDFHSDYKITEPESSNQNQRSIVQDIDSIGNTDSIDRFLELERDTIDYEKEYKEDRLRVEKRRLETEQIVMLQLSKIIKMLERNQI